MRVYSILSVLAAVLLLAACESTPESTAATTGTGAQTAVAPSMFGNSGEYGDRVFFDYDQYDLKPAARGKIEGWAEWLRENSSAQVTIEGHADERGTREYNLGLGERRATSAKNYLVALGIDASRVRTISYGKERPAAVGHDESAWALNRRGVMIQN